MSYAIMEMAFESYTITSQYSWGLITAERDGYFL